MNNFFRLKGSAVWHMIEPVECRPSWQKDARAFCGERPYMDNKKESAEKPPSMRLCRHCERRIVSLTGALARIQELLNVTPGGSNQGGPHDPRYKS